MSYTDDLGFPESVTSAGVGPIIAAFTNTVATSYPQCVVIDDNASCIISPNRYVGNMCCFFRGQAVALIRIEIASTDDDSVSNEATSGSFHTNWKVWPVVTLVASFDRQVYYF